MRSGWSNRFVIFTLFFLSSLPGSEMASAQVTTAGSTGTICSNRGTAALRYSAPGTCKSGERKVVLATGPTKGYYSAQGTADMSESSSSADVSVVTAQIPAGNYLATFTGFIDSSLVAVTSRVNCKMFLDGDFFVNSAAHDVAAHSYSNYALTGGFVADKAKTFSVRCQVDNSGNPVPGPAKILSSSVTLVQVGQLTVSGN